MKLTAFSDYTLRVLMFLALHRDRLATIPEIARAFDISESHLTKVVHRLAQGGVIESLRGRGGGIRLSREPGAIRLGDVVRDAEGDTPIVECLSGDTPHCRIAPVCKLKGALVAGFEALYERLNEYTLADLVENDRSLLVSLGRKRATR